MVASRHGVAGICMLEVESECAKHSPNNIAIQLIDSVANYGDTFAYVIDGWMVAELIHWLTVCDCLFRWRKCVKGVCARVHI